MYYVAALLMIRVHSELKHIIFIQFHPYKQTHTHHGWKEMWMRWKYHSLKRKELCLKVCIVYITAFFYLFWKRLVTNFKDYINLIFFLILEKMKYKVISLFWLGFEHILHGRFNKNLRILDFISFLYIPLNL